MAGGYLFKELQFGLILPFTQQHGNLDVSMYPLDPGTPSQVRGFAMGDMRLHLKTSIWRFMENRIRLAFSTMVSFPWTGDIPNYQAQNNFAGEKNVTIWPRFILEFHYKKLAMAGNLGFLARVEESEFFSTQVGHQFTYGVAGLYQFMDVKGITLAGLLEFFGRNGLSTELDENPIEIDAGVRLAFNWGLSVTVGGGAGIIKAVGSPVARAFLSLGWAPQYMKDQDGDGVPDYKDRCPDKKEDMDGFQDSDGCPEPDNDRDTVPDDRDKCPNVAEDMDGYQDEDGCPEPDNDGDGVCDDNPAIQKNIARFAKTCTGKDNCPMHKGPVATKGCPANMLDSDGDRVPDGVDKCPKVAEDKDGYQDGDGCPEPDNDGDGVCDANEEIQDNIDKYKGVCTGTDKCPKEKEDKDGHKDDDGCPDPDNDGDHFCDNNTVIQKNLSKYSSVCMGSDQCPDKPETINGNADADGCPDQGEPDVRVEEKKLALRRNIQFKRNTTKMVGPSVSILMQIVLHLRFKLNTFKKLVVVGFVEPRMRASKAKRVSQAWADAVKAFLVKYGIPADKIMAKGLGGANPVYTGSSKRKSKKQNRRVEFFLVK